MPGSLFLQVALQAARCTAAAAAVAPIIPRFGEGGPKGEKKDLLLSPARRSAGGGMYSLEAGAAGLKVGDDAKDRLVGGDRSPRLAVTGHVGVPHQVEEDPLKLVVL